MGSKGNFPGEEQRGFFRISPDGENGFPGEFSIVVKYEFTEENELKIFTEDALMQLPLPI